ncbi:MAG: hypothetical protein MUP11_02510, partial [Anaerolineales bacterium]|nr:hypothetical protein [Anaerolineales bacterium]
IYPLLIFFRRQHVSPSGPLWLCQSWLEWAWTKWKYRRAEKNTGPDWPRLLVSLLLGDQSWVGMF